MKNVRVNIGCGQKPIRSWHNYDNSFSIRLSKIRALHFLLNKIGALQKSQREFILFACENDIKYADATKHIPEGDHTVDVLYSSHMLEHLSRDKARLFLKEARRILVSRGIIRISVPDLKLKVTEYLDVEDADTFMEKLLIAQREPGSFLEKIAYVMFGNRDHKWMYDGKSLCRLLLAEGFVRPQIMKKGETNIKDCGGLDLYDRCEESVYVEAINP